MSEMEFTKNIIAPGPKRVNVSLFMFLILNLFAVGSVEEIIPLLKSNEEELELFVRHRIMPFSWINAIIGRGEEGINFLLDYWIKDENKEVVE